jgi:hypothetical protein
MISPEKFSKSLGNNRLKIGVSISELVICSFFPMVMNFFDFDPFISLMTFILCIGSISIKNKILAPAYIRNSIERKDSLKWERINIK